jgi:hypothetical protein
MAAGEAIVPFEWLTNPGNLEVSACLFGCLHSYVLFEVFALVPVLFVWFSSCRVASVFWYDRVASWVLSYLAPLSHAFVSCLLSMSVMSPPPAPHTPPPPSHQALFAQELLFPDLSAKRAVLHVGCGSSTLGESFVRLGYHEVLNVDCDSVMLERMGGSFSLPCFFVFVFVFVFVSCLCLLSLTLSLVFLSFLSLFSFVFVFVVCVDCDTVVLHRWGSSFLSTCVGLPCSAFPFRSVQLFSVMFCLPPSFVCLAVRRVVLGFGTTRPPMLQPRPLCCYRAKRRAGRRRGERKRARVQHNACGSQRLTLQRTGYLVWMGILTASSTRARSIV